MLNELESRFLLIAMGLLDDSNKYVSSLVMDLFLAVVIPAETKASLYALDPKRSKGCMIRQ